MPLPPERAELQKTVLLSIFASVAVVLGIVETLLPFTVSVPGAKLGLGNIMVLMCLVYFKASDALTLIALKTILTSFILGAFSTFLFSFLGAMASFLVMLALLRLGRDQFSLIGISVLGGVAHNIGQLAAAAIVLGSTKIVFYFPFLVITGLITGIFVGYAARYLVQAIDKLALFDRISLKGQEG